MITLGYTKESYNFYSNLLGNVILFIPLPFVLERLFKIKRVADLIYRCLGVSVCIEFIQYIGKLGVADIDDIILYMTGAIIAVIYLQWGDAHSRIRTKKINPTLDYLSVLSRK